MYNLKQAQAYFGMLTPPIVLLDCQTCQATSKHQSLGLNYLATRVIARATVHLKVLMLFFFHVFMFFLHV